MFQVGGTWGRLGVTAALAGALSGCYSISTPPNVPRNGSAYAALQPTAQEYQHAEYRIQPYDTISVNVFQEDDLAVDKGVVDPSGNLSMPLLGSVPAAGKTTSELAAYIADKLSPTYLKHPKVSVTLDTSALLRVTVEGEVGQPGIFPITGPTTLVQAIALAKGTTRTAKLGQVVIFRTVNGQRMAARFDLREIRAARAPDPQVLPDDIVVVGFSNARGVWQDFLSALPVVNLFRPLY
jgi:polysaccharide export outer membrane protein